MTKRDNALNREENKPKRKKRPAYVRNADFLVALAESREQDELTPEAIEMITKIATRASQRLIYQDEEDRKDCISFAISDCYMYWRNFDPEKSQNPFAYFTQVCKNGFAKAWRRLGKYHFPNSVMVRIDHDNLYSL